MAKNMKFHAIAIAVITVVIVILYLLVGPKPQAPVVVKPTDRAVRISTATWGLSCNQQIEEAQRSRESIPMAKDAEGKVIQPEPLKKVEINNVLPVIKTACEGQLGCEVNATDDILGVHLLPGCYRQLNVNYRCSDVDRLTTVNIDQGQTLKIDCTDATASAPPHP